MKFAFCLEPLFPELPFLSRIEKAAEMGIEHIEIWGWRDKPLTGFQTALSQSGLKLTNMSGHRDNSLFDPAERESLLDEFLDAVSFASACHCNQLMLLTEALSEDGSPKKTPTSLSANQKIESTVATLNELAAIAETSDFHLVLEPLNSRLDHPRFFLDTSADAFAVIRTVNHPRMKVLYDIYHMAMMDIPVLQDIEENLDLIGHFHFADKPGRNYPGTGELELKPIVELLRTLHFEGTFGFEFFPGANSEMGVRRTLEQISSFR